MRTLLIFLAVLSLGQHMAVSKFSEIERQLISYIYEGNENAKKAIDEGLKNWATEVKTSKDPQAFRDVVDWIKKAALNSETSLPRLWYALSSVTGSLALLKGVEQVYPIFCDSTALSSLIYSAIRTQSGQLQRQMPAVSRWDRFNDEEYTVDTLKSAKPEQAELNISGLESNMALVGQLSIMHFPYIEAKYVPAAPTSAVGFVRSRVTKAASIIWGRDPAFTSLVATYDGRETEWYIVKDPNRLFDNVNSSKFWATPIKARIKNDQVVLRLTQLNALLSETTDETGEKGYEVTLSKREYQKLKALMYRHVFLWDTSTIDQELIIELDFDDLKEGVRKRDMFGFNKRPQITKASEYILKAKCVEEDKTALQNRLELFKITGLMTARALIPTSMFGAGIVLMFVVAGAAAASGGLAVVAGFGALVAAAAVAGGTGFVLHFASKEALLQYSRDKIRYLTVTIEKKPESPTPAVVSSSSPTGS